MAVEDKADPIFAEFAKEYEGKTIEFDGYIFDMMHHGNYKTRYDILVLAGNFSDPTYSGPNFLFEDVNIVHDLKLTGSNIPDTIGRGEKLHITAEVREYNETTGLFLLDPVSTEIR